MGAPPLVKVTEIPIAENTIDGIGSFDFVEMLPRGDGGLPVATYRWRVTVEAWPLSPREREVAEARELLDEARKKAERFAAEVARLEKVIADGQ